MIASVATILALIAGVTVPLFQPLHRVVGNCRCPTGFLPATSWGWPSTWKWAGPTARCSSGAVPARSPCSTCGRAKSGSRNNLARRLWQSTWVAPIGLLSRRRGQREGRAIASRAYGTPIAELSGPPAGAPAQPREDQTIASRAYGTPIAELSGPPASVRADARTPAAAGGITRRGQVFACLVRRLGVAGGDCRRQGRAECRPSLCSRTLASFPAKSGERSFASARLTLV